MQKFRVSKLKSISFLKIIYNNWVGNRLLVPKFNEGYNYKMGGVGGGGGGVSLPIYNNETFQIIMNITHYLPGPIGKTKMYPKERNPSNL